jgi:alpha-mannosidase
MMTTDRVVIDVAMLWPVGFTLDQSVTSFATRVNELDQDCRSSYILP